jgi:hypothetical protein
MHGLACCAQVIKEDRGVESAGIDEDGFHEFSGSRFSEGPGNSLAGPTVGSGKLMCWAQTARENGEEPPSDDGGHGELEFGGLDHQIADRSALPKLSSLGPIQTLDKRRRPFSLLDS